MDKIKNKKDFEKTFAWISELVSAKIMTVDRHAFIPKDCPIRKDKRDFKLEFTTTDIYDALREANDQGIAPFPLYVWDNEYIIEEGGCHIAHSKSSIIPDVSDCKLSLSAFHSSGYNNGHNGYYRYISRITKDENPKCLHRIQSLPFAVGKTEYFFQLFPINLGEGEVQVGYATDKTKSDRYFFIEPRFECTAKYLYNISFPIITALGFLTGNVHLDDCFIFQYDNEDMAEPIGLEYRSLSESYHYEYFIFANNPYPYVDAALKRMTSNKTKDDNHKMLTSETGKYSGFISTDILSCLVQNFIDNDSLLRAAHTMMVSCMSTLESQPATCAVALETITSHITKKNGLKAKNVVREEVWNETNKAFNDFIDNQVAKGCMTQEEHEFIANKLKYINQPTNMDKLSLPFSYVRYKLREDEVKAIKNRNTLLHGSIGTDLKDIKKASDKLLLDTIMLHRLCGILLLKLADYSGPIINYAKAYGLDKSKDLNEIFIEI